MTCARLAWVLVVVVVGCGGSTEQNGTGGSAGSGASGGSGAVGGTGATGAVAGTGAVAATGGVAGTGAVAGTGGTGATGGTAGGTGIPPECQTAADCKLFTDCCTCQAFPLNGPPPVSCGLGCKQSVCSELGVTDANVACAAGRCVAGIDCNWGDAMCNAPPPSCPAGTVPSVVNGCWGPCVDAKQCAGLADCSACTGPLTTCVTIETQSGDTSTAHHCVGIPKGCEGTPLCACMGTNVCVSPFDACIDLSGVPGMLCSCPAC